jgi:hypothetical protein
MRPPRWYKGAVSKKVLLGFGGAKGHFLMIAAV